MNQINAKENNILTKARSDFFPHINKPYETKRSKMFEYHE